MTIWKGSTVLTGLNHTSCSKKFSAGFDKHQIGSSSSFFLGQKGGLIPFITFDIEADKRHNHVHMTEKILQAAQKTATVLKANPHLPKIRDILQAYDQLSSTLSARLARRNDSQVLYIVVMHSVIVMSAIRILRGDESGSEICTLREKYFGRTALYTCNQDVKSTVSPKKEQRIPDMQRQRRLVSFPRIYHPDLDISSPYPPDLCPLMFCFQGCCRDSQCRECTSVWQW